MVDGNSATTLLAGLPAAWMPAFVTTFSALGHSVAELTTVDCHFVEGARAIPVSYGGTDVAEALARDQAEQSPVTTAVIGALSAPTASSLEDALGSLETAVGENALAPLQLMAALIESMLLRQAGRMLLVTYDPRSMTHPNDAAIRSSSRGIFTYLESLRPALQRRGISAGMLLIAPRQRDRWEMSASAEVMAAAAAECLRKGTLQRVIKVQ